MAFVSIYAEYTKKMWILSLFNSISLIFWRDAEYLFNNGKVTHNCDEYELQSNRSADVPLK